MNGEVGVRFQIVPKLVVEEQNTEPGSSQYLKRMEELALVKVEMKKIATPKVVLVRVYVNFSIFFMV